MNDERTLAKQLKWMKQELTNLKISHKLSAGSVSMFSQLIYIETTSSRTAIITATPKNINTGFFGYVIEENEQSGVLVTDFTFDNYKAQWTITDIEPKYEYRCVVISTAPCNVTVQEG